MIPVILEADRSYSVVLDLGAIDSIERETGLSALEINEAFVAAKDPGQGRKLKVGLVYKFVVGAIASVDPTFPARARAALSLPDIHDMATALAPAWNVAIRGIYGAAEEPEKKEPETPSTQPVSSSESPPPTLG